MKTSKLNYNELVEVIGIDRANLILNEMVRNADEQDNVIGRLTSDVVCTSLQSVTVANQEDNPQFNLTVFLLIRKPLFFTQENPSLEVNPLVIYLSEPIADDELPDFVLDLMSLQKKIKLLEGLDENWLAKELTKLPL
jgi:hypothetical protein